uniref:Barttin n=1 Tax=Varanus komodoensis TaxID=61221 RepID=A0A8D2L470_VARKO
MAEEKTFRYGLIILGFFLVMVGMFIMSVEKPHIYITFCTLGILIIAVGIVWSMCQCYPKHCSVCVCVGSRTGAHRDMGRWCSTLSPMSFSPSGTGCLQTSASGGDLRHTTITAFLSSALSLSAHRTPLPKGDGMAKEGCPFLTSLLPPLAFSAPRGVKVSRKCGMARSPEGWQQIPCKNKGLGPIMLPLKVECLSSVQLCAESCLISHP